MTIHRKEITVIPQTADGRKFASEYEQRLRRQGAYKGREESTTSITITAMYHLDINMEEQDVLK